MPDGSSSDAPVMRPGPRPAITRLMEEASGCEPVVLSRDSGLILCITRPYPRRLRLCASAWGIDVAPGRKKRHGQLVRRSALRGRHTRLVQQGSKFPRLVIVARKPELSKQPVAQCFGGKRRAD